MNNIVSEWAESPFPIYRAVSVQSLYATSNLPSIKIHEEYPVLAAVGGGKGILRINDQSFDLVQDTVVRLPASLQATLITDPLQPLHVYKLSIGTFVQPFPAPDGPALQRSEVLSGGEVRIFPNEPAMAAKIEELYVHRYPAQEIRYVQNQIVFYRIIEDLLEREGAKYADHEQPSMERSIAFVEHHYHEKITREQLAAMAGISSSHYSILFKRVTGFSPQEYLARLRVHRAVELMISGSGTLREIAQKVGYKDEFYLSRRFKQQTGVSPTAYSSFTPERVAVHLTPYASHMLLLGLEPVLTIAESNEYIHIGEQAQPKSMRFIHADCSPEQLKSALYETKTELIIASKQHMNHYGMSPEQLRAMAPVVEVSWMELGWKEHFRLIARAIQRSERAEAWLAAFEQEETSARLAVQRSSVAGETLTILVVRPEELLVYGGRNVGYVMYHSLGLRPPLRIRQAMDKLGTPFHSMPIVLSELEEFAGDRIMVIIFPDSKGSTAHADAIFQSREWRDLAAVQRNQVHHLDVDDWVPYNPVSIRLQLQRAVALFTSIQ